MEFDAAKFHKMLKFKAGIDFVYGPPSLLSENKFHDRNDYYNESILWNRCRRSVKVKKFVLCTPLSSCSSSLCLKYTDDTLLGSSAFFVYGPLAVLEEAKTYWIRRAAQL
jgi:hypothetical protein